MSKELIQAATDYLNAGLSVIALAGKMPNTAIHRRGLHDAIEGTVETDEDRALLAEVFGHPETTGVGLPIPAHLVVVDIDGEEGAVEFQRLVGDGWDRALETPAARTGRGLHLWYASPQPRGSRKLGAKLDLKGIGGYVAAPPSRHPDGHVYEWLDELVVDGALVGVEFLPEGIERLLGDMDAIDTDNHVERPTYYEFNLSLQDGAWRLRRTLCPPPIDGLVRAVETAPEGNRNNMLAWAALQARDEGVTLEVAMRDLGGAAAKAGLTPEETRTTIRSAFRRSRS